MGLRDLLEGPFSVVFGQITLAFFGLGFLGCRAVLSVWDRFNR